MAEFSFLNNLYDLSKLKSGIKISEENKFLKKYDANNNSVFDSDEINQLKQDIETYVDDGVFDEDETISLYAKIMNISTAEAKEVFKNNDNLVMKDLDDVFMAQYTRSEAIKQNTKEIDDAIKIYHSANEGIVSKLGNSIKEIFNTQYAGDKVYRQLAKSKASAMMLEMSENNQLTGKEYVETKIELLEFLLNIDELPENEQKIIKNAILNSNMQEIDTLIEKLANAEDSEYEELKKDCLNGLKESVTDNKEIGFMNVSKPNSVKSFLESEKSDKLMDFNKTYKLENGVEYNQDLVENYLQEEREFMSIARINNEIAHKYESLESCIKNGDIEELKSEINDILTYLLGNNSEKEEDYLQQLGFYGIENLTKEELQALAKKLQDELVTKLNTLLDGKTIEEHMEELKNAKERAFGTKNNIDLAERFAESQENCVGNIKMVASGVGFIATLAGGPIALVGIGISVAGGAGISFVEEASKKGPISDDEKKEILKELAVSGALNAAGFGSGTISSAIGNILKTKCPTLIAKIAEYGSDTIMSLLSDAAITGEVDLAGEGIAQIINIATGIAVSKKGIHNSKINKENNRLNVNDVVTKNLQTQSPNTKKSMELEEKLVNVQQNHPQYNLLQDIAINTERSAEEIECVAQLMEKYPDFAEDIAKMIKSNFNIKIIPSDLRGSAINDIDRIIMTIKENPQYEEDIIKYMSIQRRRKDDTTDPTAPLKKFIALLEKYPDNKAEIEILTKNTNLISDDMDELLYVIIHHPEKAEDILYLAGKNYHLRGINLQLALMKKHPELRDIIMSDSPKYKLIDDNIMNTPDTVIATRHKKREYLEDIAPRKMKKLQKTLGDEYYYKVKWEDIIPENATKSEIKDIIDGINDMSKFFTRLSVNEKQYGKDIQWANEMNKICNIGEELIKKGESLDSVLNIISLEYNTYDIKNSLDSNQKYDNDRRVASGKYRGDQYPNAYAVTPYDKDSNYSEYFDRFNAGKKRKSPYDDMYLTGVVQTDDKGGLMMHPRNSNVEPGMAHVRDRYDELIPFIEKVNSGAELTKKDIKIIDEKIAEIYYLIANIMPYERGSNGIADILMRSIYRALGIEMPALKHGVSLDLEAFDLDLDEYKKKWNTFFESE